ncbi:hypothetical protein Emed_003895 [Eimeria media]
MADLEALRAQFMSLQAAPQQQRISESTCLDVLQLLLQRQLLRLLPSTNGKELITPERLDQELRILKGRLSVAEAAQTLGFGGSAVAAAVESLSKKMGGAFLLDDELITSQYLQTIAEEATEILEEKGQLQLAELCQKHSLPLSFLKQEIGPRLDSSLGVTMRGSALETAAYAAHVTATARGLLLGASGPLQLSEAAKALNVPLEGLVSACQSLLASGCLRGELSSNTFSPAIYLEGPVLLPLRLLLLSVPVLPLRVVCVLSCHECCCSKLLRLLLLLLLLLLRQRQQHQGLSYFREHGTEAVSLLHAQVVSSWEAEGLVSFDFLRSLLGTGWRTFVSSRLAEARELSSVFIKESLLLSPKAALEEALVEGSWVELSPLLPAGLPEADVAAAVSLLMSPAARGSSSPGRGGAAAAASQGLGLHALDGGLVVSEAFLSSLFEELRPLAEQKAKEAAAARLAAPKTAAASPAAAPAAASQKQQQQQQAKAPAAEESDWEADTKRKGKKGKASKSSGSKQKSGTSAAAQQQRQQQQQQDQGLDMAEVDAAGIASWESLPDHAKEAFWSLIQPRIKEVFAAALAASQASVLQQQQQKAAAEGELLQQDYERLCLGFKALEALGVSEPQEQQKPHPICAYFFKTKVMDAIDRLLLIARLCPGTAAALAAAAVVAAAVAAAAVAAAVAAAAAVAGEEVEVSSNNRQQLLSRLAGNGDKSSSTAAAALQQAAATAAKREVHAMAEVLKEAASECFVYVGPMSRRAPAAAAIAAAAAAAGLAATSLSHGGTAARAAECLRPPDKRRVKQLLSDQRNYWGGAAVAAVELRQHSRLCHAALNLLLLREGVWVEFPEEEWAISSLIDLLLQQKDKDSAETLSALQAFRKALNTEEEEALHEASQSLLQKLMP